MKILLQTCGFGAVEKVRFYPQTPQGGLYNLLDLNKSPLGDLGVNMRRLVFSTPSQAIIPLKSKLFYDE